MHRVMFWLSVPKSNAQILQPYLRKRKNSPVQLSLHKAVSFYPLISTIPKPDNFCSFSIAFVQLEVIDSTARFLAVDPSTIKKLDCVRPFAGEVKISLFCKGLPRCDSMQPEMGIAQW